MNQFFPSRSIHVLLYFVRLSLILGLISSQFAHIFFAPSSALAAAPEIQLTIPGTTYGSTIPLTSDSNGYGATAQSAKSGLLCTVVPASCVISNVNNVVNPPTTPRARISILLNVANTGTGSIRVQSNKVIPAGTKAGFLLNKGGGLLDLSVFGDLTITTLKGGATQETKSGSSVLSVSLLGGTGDNLVGFTTTKDFDAIEISVTSLIGAAFNLDVGYAYIQPQVVDFGNQNVGSTSTSQTITVQNQITSDAALTLNGFILGGTDVTQFAISGGTCGSTFPKNVAVGSSCTVLVTFSPTTGGVKNATLTVLSNDGDEASTSIPLTGTGVTVIPTITSNGGGATATISVAENVTAVTTVTANGVPTPSYSIAGGVDASAFQIDSGTGALSFKNAPDFEIPSDNGSNNTYDVVVRATNIAGSDDQAIAVTVTNVDESLPNTQITSQPANPSNTTSPAFSFTGSDDITSASNLTFECRIDNGSWSACTSPQSYTNLVSGTHTFEVHAKDQAGKVDDTPAVYTWTIDITAPDTDIATKPGNPTNSVAATFDLTGLDNVTAASGLTFECQLDHGGWTSCTSPIMYSNLLSGTHTFEVRAKDAAGLVDGSPAVYTWTIDTTSPHSTIISKPTSVSNSSSGTFVFDGSDNVTSAGSLTFECKLDNGNWTTCSSPTTYNGLSDGNHTFQVRTTDAAGNTDSQPATYSWKIDTLVPGKPTISVAANSPDRTPVISGTAEISSTVTVGIDTNNDGNDDITYSVTPNSNGQWSVDTGTATPATGTFPAGGLTDGGYSASAKVTDAATNTSPSASALFVVDGTAPSASITSQPVDPTNTTSATLAFTGTDNLTPLASLTFECQLDGSAWLPCSSPVSYSSLSEGTHIFNVQVKDLAGNSSTPAATATWFVDTTGTSIVSITSTSQNRTYTVGESINLTVNLSNPVVTGSTLTLTLTTSDTVTLTCTNGPCTTLSGDYTVGVGDTTTDLSVATISGTLTDAAGNVASNPAIPQGQNLGDNAAIVIEATTPTITSADTSSISENSTAVLTVTATGAPAPTFSIVGGADQALFAIDPTTGALSFLAAPDFEVPTDSGSDNSYIVTVRATNSAGSADQTITITVNDVNEGAPDTVIIIKPASLTNSTSATFTFTGTDDVTPVNNLSFECQLDVRSSVVCSSPMSYTSLTDGSHTFRVRAKDAEGQLDISPAVYTWTVDTIAPAITSITSSTPDGIYTVGDTIDLTVHFTEPIAKGSTLNLILTTGGAGLTPRTSSLTLTCESDSCETLRGTYTVKPGDMSNDLSVASVNGKLTDLVGNVSMLPTVPNGQNLNDNENIRIDTTDSDGDGIPDIKDMDSDNDGVPDSVEVTDGTTPTDPGSYKDTDGDTLPDYIEGDGDSDKDGLPHYRDTDSDGDGVSDRDEGTKDTDNDGVADRLEPNTRDTDRDGLPNYRDSDDDGDGIPTKDEDLNGNSNWFDDDHDGDGIPAFLDPNDAAGQPNGGDSDGDGLSDHVECPNGAPCPDTDGNGVPDYTQPDRTTTTRYTVYVPIVVRK